MKPVSEILLRYVFGIFVSFLVLTFSIFSLIFKPLTIWPVFLILKLFYVVSLNGMIRMTVAGHEILFIDACIASSAFLLLFLFNILTRDIFLKKRILIFLFDCILLLVLNILRLVILIILLVNNSAAFDLTHKVFWYVLSIVFVVAIWFFSARFFRIRTVPFYSDLKFLISLKKKS